MEIPYCPNAKCKYHHGERPQHWYWKKGFDYLKREGKTQRYQCCYCGRTFNLNYFSIDYYVKRSGIDYQDILEMSTSSSGIRNMARKLKCSPKVIINRQGRLARQIMAVMARELKDLKLSEDLCADGLESFVLSQYFPNNINLLVGHRSQFIYDTNYFYMRRKGRMTEEQKQRKDALYQIAHVPKRMPSDSFEELLDEMCRLINRSDKKCFILDTDENPIYLGRIKKHPILKTMKEFLHRTTNSKEERNTNNKLFPCNYIDLLVRNSMAEHIRETIKFAKNSCNSMNRFALFQFYHNYIKEFRINKKASQPHITHAEVAGVCRERVNRIIDRVFHGVRETLEFVEEFLSPFQRRLWQMEIPNPLKVAVVPK